MLMLNRQTIGRLLCGAFALTLTATGCSLGGENSAPSDECDPSLEDPCTLICSAQLRITGTLVPAGTPPLPEDGCVPSGTWTFNAEVVQEANTCGDVPVAGEYVYNVTEDDLGSWVVELVSGPYPGEDQRLSMRGEGAGDCVGGFEHTSLDSTTYLYLQPVEIELAIGGVGEYELHTAE